jgi:hypothetical protein
MTASGAIGDLQKTMESFANQSRVMAEAWQQIKTYAGVLLTYTIQESGLFTKFNAILLFIGDALKALAQDMDAIVSFGGDIFGGTTDSANDASDAIDKVQGKLLDFDKFRAMNQADDSPIGLDTTLLDALTRYSSVIDGYVSDARKLADEWLEAFGITRDANGELVGTEEALTKVKNTIKLITSAIGVLFGLGIISSLVRIGKGINTYAITPIINLTKKIYELTKPYILKAISAITKEFSLLNLAISAVSAVLGYLVGDMLLGSLGEDARKTVAPIMLLVGALTSLAVALLAINGIVKGAWVLPVIMGSLGIAVAGLKGMIVDNYAEGGMPDKGTIFRAGEAGAEVVYNTPSGQSGVANVQQIAQATYSGTMQALNDWWGGNNARRDIPQLKNATATGMYEVVKSEARRRGDW